MDQISLWFVCKSCRFSFSGVTNFIKHKTDSHFSEYKSVTCIVFEESFSNVEGDIITKPEGEGFVEDHVDEDSYSETSQSPNVPLNNNISTFTNSDCKILEEIEHFTNHELDNAESRAVSFTIENDSVLINIGPSNDVDYDHSNQIPLTQVDTPENEICEQALIQSTTVTVEEILDSSNSEEKPLFSPDIQENWHSELTVFSPESVDLALDSSQDVDTNSVIFSFDVCADVATVVDGVDSGPSPVPFQDICDQVGNTFKIKTPSGTVELLEHEQNKDVSHSQSYGICVKIIDNKYSFVENPVVLLRRLTAKELQDALSISKEPIEKRQKLNSREMQVESETSEPPKTRCLNTNPNTTAQQKLPHSLHCDLCNKSFYYRSGVILHNFINHLSMEEKIAQAQFKCDQYPRVFLRKGAFKCHTEIHKSKTEQNRPFVCEICGHSCTLKSGLKKHSASHSDMRPLKCHFPNCDKTFKRKQHLETHEKLFHSTLRPFKCSHPNCIKTFKERKTLDSHILGVHGAKSRYPSQIFPCTQENCDKNMNRVKD